MRRLIDKYIDGELTDDEAAAFLAAVESDPGLESELRSWEAMFATVASADLGVAPAGLTDNVMARVRAAAPAVPAARSRAPSRPWWPWSWQVWVPRLAWGVGLAALFVLGRVTAPGPIGEAPGPSAGPAPTAPTAPTALRVIRMVFVPDNAAVEHVGVAGTFNGWNATALPMERRGDAFVTQVILPPGSYEYMFVVDGETWVTDPLAVQTRDDGFGRENAVLDVSI